MHVRLDDLKTLLHERFGHDSFRPGQLACCTLIYRPGDLGRAAFLSTSAQLEREDVERLRQGLLAHPRATSRELEQATGSHRREPDRAV